MAFGIGKRDMEKENVTLLILSPRGDGIIHSIDSATKTKAVDGEAEEYKTRKHGRIPRAKTDAMTASQLAVLVQQAPDQYVQLDLRAAIKDALMAKPGDTVDKGVKIETLSETAKEFFVRKVESANRYKKKSKWMEYAPMITAIALLLIIVACGIWWWSPMQNAQGQTAMALGAVAAMERTNTLIFNKTMNDYGAQVKYVNGTIRITPLSAIESQGGGWKPV